MTYPTSETIRAHGPWWLYCGERVRVREENGRAWVLLKGGWVYVPSTDQSSWGGSVRLWPGDLVTGANAPEGSPTWLGMIPKGMDSSTYEHPSVYVRELGYPYPILYKAEGVRPVIDSEAVGLSEALTWERWRPFGTAGVLALFLRGGVIALATPRGEWSVTAPIGGGRIGRIAGGKETWQAEGVIAASRALLRWMCEGLRGVDEARVS